MDSSVVRGWTKALKVRVHRYSCYLYFPFVSTQIVACIASLPPVAFMHDHSNCVQFRTKVAQGKPYQLCIHFNSTVRYQRKVSETIRFNSVIFIFIILRWRSDVTPACTVREVRSSGKIVAQFMLSFLYTDLSQFSINFVLMLFCTVWSQLYIFNNLQHIQYKELIDITRKLTTYLPIANTSYNNSYVQVRGPRTVFARFRSKLHVRVR
jgi:hypothetical protein